MNAELKELAEKAGFDLEFGHVLALASHEEVAEFAALIEEEVIQRCKAACLDEANVWADQDGAPDPAPMLCRVRIHKLPRRWRSVIPSKQENDVR